MLGNSVTQPDGLRANFAEIRQWIASTERVLNGTVSFGGTISWTNVTGTPTTLAGYGIADAQPLDDELTAIAGLTSGANTFAYFTGVGTAALTNLTSFSRGLLDKSDAATWRSTLGLQALAVKTTVAEADIDNAVVTLAKIANAAANSKLLGSGAAGVGASYSEITLGTGLSMSGTTLNASATLADGDYGDITVSSSGAVWTIDNGVVTLSKIDSTTVRLDTIAAPTGSVNFADQQALSFRIENRTSDPGSPTVGQLWIRTDL